MQTLQAVSAGKADALLNAARALLKEQKVCYCRECKAQNFRAQALELVDLVVESYHAKGIRSGKDYFDALKVRAECTASYPCWAAGGWAMTAVDVVYTKCVRPQSPAASA